MSNYYSDEPRSNFGLYFFLMVIAIGLIGIGLFAAQCSFNKSNNDPPSPRSDQAREKSEILPDEPAPVSDPTNPTLQTTEEKTAAEILTAAGMGGAELDPAKLLEQIADALEEKQFASVAKLIGENVLTEGQLRDLQERAAANQLRINRMRPISEIGELEANRRARWALNLDDAFSSRIYFDLARKENTAWMVEKVTLPPRLGPGQKTPSAVFVDSLGITTAFLSSVLEQNFDDAKSFVDSEKVSDAKIAGLCIIFEEANYRLRDKKPLRAMFNRETVAGFMIYVQDDSGEHAAEFGINLQRSDNSQPWRVTEISLDQLLADYATRVAGGDIHFTPLIKNPAGGETLILYFGFDENTLSPRTTRQLDIVASLLKIDSNKKLTLSGHADALGTDDYNTRLSEKRALAVKEYLLSVGVTRNQMVTLAEGEAKPRRPNVTHDGKDDPSGRRANRRTEIYLDF